MGADVISETLREVGAEVSADHLRFIAELVQFGILILLLRMLVVGMGRRRGIVASAVQRRSDALVARISRAAAVDDDVTAIRMAATDRSREAETEARTILEQGRREAERRLAQACTEADLDAENARSRAEEAIARETDEERERTRQILIGIVANASRSLLTDAVPPERQRELIERALLGVCAETEESRISRADEMAEP